ncbi:zinc finger protein 287-like [Condylostylus longicornis]|uniref:zinc finger protein 287-like n=1 Tax=Condylostylus longicornis TaxID=2530218 RepID=UPI00244E1369|nr:zinc finger protein 287-like [Condylostylus longicornis]
MEEKKCCLCGENIKGIFGDLFNSYSKHSKVFLSEILHKILKQDWIKSEENWICYLCINRINKYEFGMLLVKQMEEEILESISLNRNNQFIFVTSFKEEESNENDLEVEECYSTSDVDLTKVKDDEINEDSIDVAIDDSQDNIFMENIIDDHTEDVKIETIIDIQPLKVSPVSKHYYCEKCNILFLSLSEFEKHNEIQHGERVVPLQCHVCGVTYTTAKKLNNHMRSHQGPIKCPICNKQITQKGALKRHMVIHTGEKSYQCDICGKQFIHRSSFRMHNLAHGNIREVTCQVCGFKLRSRSHLSRHMLIHTGEKKHECPKCGQKFAQRYNMNVHLKLHEGIKRQKSAVKYKCRVCDLKFESSKALEEHNESYVHVGKSPLEFENVIDNVR